MDIEFVNYSQIRQQESFRPENIWVVSRIAGSEGAHHDSTSRPVGGGSIAASHPGCMPGLHLVKALRETLPALQLLAKPPQNPEPRHVDPTFQEKKKALLQMTNQVAETCKRAEDTHASEMARTLYMFMGDIPSAAPMLPLLPKATTGSQISTPLAVHTPNFAKDCTMVIERLQQWQSLHITNEAGRVASEAAKVACLEALHAKFNAMDQNALD